MCAVDQRRRGIARPSQSTAQVEYSKPKGIRAGVTSAALGIGLSSRKRILGHALLTDLGGLANYGEAVVEQTVFVNAECLV